MPIAPKAKMKNFQWDKLPHQQVSKTLWQEEDSSKEKEMIAKLSGDGIWLEMEKNFEAKQLMINLLGTVLFPRLQVTCTVLIIWSSLAGQRRAELKSVLDPQTKKRVGQYPFYVRSVRECLILGQRNPYSTRKEARAGGDRPTHQGI